MRILGLDYGSKTVGVAISDTRLIIATPLETICRQDEKSIKKTIKRLEVIIKEEKVTKIILGYPINMNGTEGERCIKTKEFKERLERNFKKTEVILKDERLSTKFATMILDKSSTKKSKQKKVVDKIAASFILQGYLDAIANNTEENKC